MLVFVEDVSTTVRNLEIDDPNPNVPLSPRTASQIRPILTNATAGRAGRGQGSSMSASEMLAGSWRGPRKLRWR